MPQASEQQRVGGNTILLLRNRRPGHLKQRGAGGMEVEEALKPSIESPLLGCVLPSCLLLWG